MNDDLARQIAVAVQREVERVQRRTGTVSSFTSSRVTVAFAGGGSMSLPYLATYVPAAGHVVHVDCSRPDGWLVLGRAAT